MTNLQRIQDSVSSYAVLKKRVEETLLLGQRRVEQEKVRTYWLTGKLIDDFLLKGSAYADKGKEVISRLSQDLGVSERILYQTVQFARAFPNLNARSNLSWAHYRKLATVSNAKKRQQLLAQAEKSEWTSRELEIKVSQLNALESDPAAKAAFLKPPQIGS